MTKKPYQAQEQENVGLNLTSKQNVYYVGKMQSSNWTKEAMMCGQ